MSCPPGFRVCLMLPSIYQMITCSQQRPEIHVNYFTEETEFVSFLFSATHLNDMKRSNGKKSWPHFFQHFLISASTQRRRDKYFNFRFVSIWSVSHSVFCLMWHINKTILYCHSFVSFDVFFLWGSFSILIVHSTEWRAARFSFQIESEQMDYKMDL